MMEENLNMAYISRADSNIAQNSENILIPKKGSEDAAAYDLYAACDGIIPAGTNRAVNTGVKIKLPKGTYAKIEMRSGLALKNCLFAMAGVIDSDYTGEWKVIIYNAGKNDFEYKKNMRIAQFIVLKHENIKFTEVENLDLTNRGEKGFGSTGN